MLIYLLPAMPAGLYPLPIDGKKYPLPHPEIRSFVSQVPWSYTSKSLVSYTEVPCFKAHPDIARSSSPAGESTSFSLSSNRYPVALSLAPGFPHPFGQPFPCRCRHQIRTVKDRQFLPPVTPDFEFIQHHNPIVLLPYKDKQ